LKGVVLSVLLGLPLVSGILWFFEYAGPSAWWLSWLAVVLFMLVIQYVAPTWIMPLFNRFEPLQDGELKSAILAYARRIQFPLDNIFVMDGSKRSRKANAFFTGFANRKRIVLFDTLIEQHSVTELLAVLAHEIGHYKKKHILESLILGILQTGILFFLLKILIVYPPLFDAFGMPAVSVYGGLVFFALLYSPVDAATGLLMLARSRHNEYEADRFAVATTHKGRELVEALKKLAANNLSNLVPHPFYVVLNYSHPPVLDRIRAIHAMADDTATA
jgi:STE24 endopeptidase